MLTSLKYVHCIVDNGGELTEGVNDFSETFNYNLNELFFFYFYRVTIIIVTILGR